MGAKLENCVFSFKQFSNERIQPSGPLSLWQCLNKASIEEMSDNAASNVLSSYSYLHCQGYKTSLQQLLLLLNLFDKVLTRLFGLWTGVVARIKSFGTSVLLFHSGFIRLSGRGSDPGCQIITRSHCCHPTFYMQTRGWQKVWTRPENVTFCRLSSLGGRRLRQLGDQLIILFCPINTHQILLWDKELTPGLLRRFQKWRLNIGEMIIIKWWVFGGGGKSEEALKAWLKLQHPSTFLCCVPKSSRVEMRGLSCWNRHPVHTGQLCPPTQLQPTSTSSPTYLSLNAGRFPPILVLTSQQVKLQIYLSKLLKTLRTHLQAPHNLRTHPSPVALVRRLMVAAVYSSGLRWYRHQRAPHCLLPR